MPSQSHDSFGYPESSLVLQSSPRKQLHSTSNAEIVITRKFCQWLEASRVSRFPGFATDKKCQEIPSALWIHMLWFTRNANSLISKSSSSKKLLTRCL